MKLYATGLNAWSQLRFNAGNAASPEDIYEFEAILEGEHIKRPTCGLAYTKVWCDGKYRYAGVCVPEQDDEAIPSHHLGPVENFAGETLKVETGLPHNEGGSSKYTIVKETLPRSATDEVVRQSWPRSQPIKQIAAFHVGFIILYDDGTVETLGDRRFQDCLGRDVDEENPAEEPHIVQALHDLGDPVRKVAAGGYTVAALTESGALYIWGMPPPGNASEQQVIAGLENIPNYVEVDEDRDVKDVALGESHAIALTADGQVYVIGRNDDGQLGLGKDSRGSADSWVKVPLRLPPDYHVVSVAAGPRASFILISH